MLAIPEETRICGFCKTPFIVRGYELKKPIPRKFCSRPCKHRGLSVHPKAKPLTPEEAAWFAGVFDGEGWISWPNRKVLTTFKIGIANTSLPLLQRIQMVTGTGSIIERRQTNSRYSQFWVWSCCSQNAASLLKQSVGWLIVKRESVEVAIGIRHADIAPITKRGLAQSHRSKT